MKLFDDIVIDLEDAEGNILDVEKNIKKAIAILERPKGDKQKAIALLEDCVELLNPDFEDMEIEMEDEK